jgi:hypothetical protein
MFGLMDHGIITARAKLMFIKKVIGLCLPALAEHGWPVIGYKPTGDGDTLKDAGGSVLPFYNLIIYVSVKKRKGYGTAG